MPAAVVYRPENRDLREAATRELEARRRSCAAAWKYYDGKHPRHLKIDKKGIDDNVVINLCKQIVDRTVSFLVPKFPALELDELKDTAQEEWLRLAWEANEGGELLADMAMTGCLNGHVFARVMEPEEGSYPRIVNLDPANVLVFWRADDFKTVLWYEVHWSMGETMYRQDIVDLDGAWEISTWRSQNYGNSTWNPVGETVEWNYPLSPIYDWQHGRRPHSRYGVGEITNPQLNDSVNKVTSDNRRIVRHHAGPKTVGTGFEADQLTATAIENFWTIEDKDAKVYNLEMKSNLEASEGLAARLRQEFMAEARIVTLKGEVSDFQRVTNLALRALFFDQLNKNDELQRVYGKGIREISKRLRMVSGAEDFTSNVKVVFADPLPIDPMEQVNVLKTEKELGTISKQTIAEERGRNWQQELQRMDEEGDDETKLIESITRNSI